MKHTARDYAGAQSGVVRRCTTCRRVCLIYQTCTARHTTIANAFVSSFTQTNCKRLRARKAAVQSCEGQACWTRKPGGEVLRLADKCGDYIGSLFEQENASTGAQSFVTAIWREGTGCVTNWVVVEDASGSQLGPGDIRAREVSVTPKLDAAGRWSAVCIGSDRRALDLLQVNRVVRIYRQTHGNPAREIGAGIITTRQFVEDPGKHTLRVDGPDLLEELRRKNTLLGREFAQDTLNDVVQVLVALVPGWTATVESAIQNTLVEARFDGTNILKALIELAHRYDCHLRLGGTPGQRIVQISRLNNATLHTFRNAPTVAGDFGGSGVVLRVKEDKIATTGDNYYNVLMPVGAGEGEAALTLATTTRVTPYPIQSVTGPDLRTLYYVATRNYPAGGYTDFRSDPAAIVKVAQMRDIGPLSQSTADIRNAADALYDEAAEKLKRAAMIQEVYDVTLTGVAAQIKAGDRARILYHSDAPGNTGRALPVRGRHVHCAGSDGDGEC